MTWIRAYIAKFTMYRLMIQFLLGLLGIAAVLSWFGLLPFSGFEIILTALLAVAVCYGANWLLGRIFRVRPNMDSAIITGLILSLIVGPSLSAWSTVMAASLAAMTAKYILKINNRHLFNPAAFGIVFTALTLQQGASWWIGVGWMTPLVIAGGILIATKVHRGKLVAVFALSYLALFIIFNATSLPLETTGQLLKGILLNSPLFFFSFVMLIEPQTSPNDSNYHVAYALAVAAAVSLVQKFASGINFSLEGALLVGNTMTRLVQNDAQYNLELIKKERLAPSIVGFWFRKPPRLNFTAGQFLEWTLPHHHADNRGIRHWFTISASPTEDKLLLTTKFAEKSSSFKTALQQLEPGDHLSAAGLEGDFVIPDDTNRPLVFMAGGIGITPFRSMIKYLVDESEKQPITLFYAAKTPEEYVFTDLFAEAEKVVGLKTVYVAGEAPKNWHGEIGQIQPELIKKYVKDLSKPLFYISGPEPMVEALGKMLQTIGIKKSQIKQDFFPGYE